MKETYKATMFINYAHRIQSFISLPFPTFFYVVLNGIPSFLLIHSFSKLTPNISPLVSFFKKTMLFSLNCTFQNSCHVLFQHSNVMMSDVNSCSLAPLPPWHSSQCTGGCWSLFAKSWLP